MFNTHLAKFFLDNNHHRDAFKYFCLAAEQGHADSQYHAGHLFFHGVGCPEDFAEGLKLWQLAAAQGHADAQADLCGLFFHGNFGVKKNLVEAAKYARMASDQGFVKGQTQLGIAYLRGLGVEQDSKEGLRLVALAADQGDEAMQLQAAKLYHQGVGTEANSVEAARYYRLAMEQGNRSAHYLHAVLTMNGGVEPTDVEEYQRLFISSVDGGHPKAQLSAAQMLLRGEGDLTADKNEAVRLCRLAVAQDYAPAMTFLGKLLAVDAGDGALHYKPEAVALFRRAWKQDPEAALVLGTMLYRGDGVAIDLEQACVMFIHAVESGLKSEVVDVLKAEGHQGSFEDFKRRIFPMPIMN